MRTPDFAQSPSYLGHTLPVHGPPTFGVSQKWLPRSLYGAQNSPLRSKLVDSDALSKQRLPFHLGNQLA